MAVTPYTTAAQGGSYSGADASANFPTGATQPGAAPSSAASKWQNVLVTTGPGSPMKVSGWGHLTPPGAPETHTVKDLLSAFSQESPDQVMAMQQQLWDSGFYKGKKPNITPGAADYTTLTAFQNALKDAARTTTPLGDLLDQRAAERKKAGLATPFGPDAQAQVNIVQHRSLGDMTEGALQGFQAALGRGPTAKEAAAFQAAYRASEAARDPQNAKAGASGTVNVTDPGSVDTAAKQFAIQQNPNDAQSYSKLQAFGTMLNALGVKG